MKAALDQTDKSKLIEWADAFVKLKVTSSHPIPRFGVTPLPTARFFDVASPAAGQAASCKEKVAVLLLLPRQFAEK